MRKGYARIMLIVISLGVIVSGYTASTKRILDYNYKNVNESFITIEKQLNSQIKLLEKLSNNLMENNEDVDVTKLNENVSIYLNSNIIKEKTIAFNNILEEFNHLFEEITSDTEYKYSRNAKYLCNEFVSTYDSMDAKINEYNNNVIILNKYVENSMNLNIPTYLGYEKENILNNLKV